MLHALSKNEYTELILATLLKYRSLNFNRGLQAEIIAVY